MVDKVKENYLRRKAKRLGVILHKSTAKKWRMDDHMGYAIEDDFDGQIIRGKQYEMTLDDVEAYLQEREDIFKNQ